MMNCGKVPENPQQEISGTPYFKAIIFDVAVLTANIYIQSA